MLPEQETSAGPSPEAFSSAQKAEPDSLIEFAKQGAPPVLSDEAREGVERILMGQPDAAREAQIAERGGMAEEIADCYGGGGGDDGDYIGPAEIAAMMPGAVAEGNTVTVDLGVMTRQIKEMEAMAIASKAAVLRQVMTQMAEGRDSGFLLGIIQCLMIGYICNEISPEQRSTVWALIDDDIKDNIAESLKRARNAEANEVSADLAQDLMDKVREAQQEVDRPTCHPEATWEARGFNESIAVCSVCKLPGFLR